MNIFEVLKAGTVQRYHSVDLSVRQDVSQHTWEACVIALYLDPNCSANVLKYLMMHDVAERFTGDIPAPIKANNKTIKSLFDTIEKEYLDSIGWEIPEVTEEEYYLIKQADILSGIYFSHKRVIAGDTDAVGVREEFIKYLKRLPYNHKVESLYRNIIGAKS